MGKKHTKKPKTTGDTDVMEASASLGVRTRAAAKALALKRLSSSSAPDSSCYLQLRSRRLEKPPSLQTRRQLKPRIRKSGSKIDSVNSAGSGCGDNSPEFQTRQQSRRENKMDGVSNLPDEVLCHILSFLTTKEAALTSVLAKRWRNLLAFVPSLTIDDSVFLHPEEGKKCRPDIKQSFTNFVDRVLTLQGNSPLKKLSLKCGNTYPVDGWISNALARGVSDLDLTITERYQLSPKCSTLVKLKLNRWIDIALVASGGVSLPLLKTLVLDSVRVSAKGFETLLNALPSLEELLLVHVRWKDRDVTVSSASLKTLTIELDRLINSVSFDTPSLVRFKYTGSTQPDFRVVVDMGNLVDAHIFFDVPRYQYHARDPAIEYDQGLEYDHQVAAFGYTNVGKLFHGIRNVLNLVLFPATNKVLSACSSQVLENLKSLALRSDKVCGWQAVPGLLGNCPRLETLVIEGPTQDETCTCRHFCDCYTREGKGLSLGCCPVKVMKIHGFQGTVKEMAMIESFLHYLPCLEEMRVYVQEENSPTTELEENHGVSKRVLEMFELYNKSSRRNVKLMVGDVLCV